MQAQVWIAASWLTSGWIDVAMIGGWMALVAFVGARVWRAGGAPESPPAGRASRPAKKRRAR